MVTVPRAHEDNEKFRALIDDVKDYAIFELDLRGRIVSWNAGAREIKQYEPYEVLGRPFTIFYTPEDLAAGRPASLLRRALADGRVEDEGFRVRKDGTRFWANVVLTTLRDAHGKPCGFVKVTRDLTERRRAEELLRHSEERLRLLIESVEDYAIFMLDLDGRVTSWNTGAQRIKGYSAAEILGQHFSTFYTPEDIASGKPARELATARSNGRVEEQGWRVRRDGSRFWANVIITAVHDSAGTLRGFAKVTRDMTELRRAEEELAARAAQQETIAELALAAMRMHDLQALIERAVERVSRSLGAERVALLECLDSGGFLVRASRGFPDDEREEIHAALAERLQPEWDAHHGTYVSQGEILVEIHASPEAPQRFGVLAVVPAAGATVTQGQIRFIEAIANVIASTVARHAAEAQQRLAELAAERERARTLRAEQAVRERDDFISVAAHELRTPLTALSLHLENIARMMRSGRVGVTPERIAAAHRQTRRLADLVERLLDVSRIALGRLEVHRTELDLAAVVRQAIEDASETARQADSRLVLDTDGPVLGAWDRARIEQVLANLLSNAFRYGAGKPVEIRLGVVRGRARLTVTDYGPGVASADRERIFKRFERAASAQHYGGLGLGLYITRHIVEAHGGTIHVEEEPGKGATFVVDLPLA
jgi:PAS domain S-box-containing protein